VKLSVSFLNERDPKLIWIFTRCKDRFKVLAWQSVINEHKDPVEIFEEPEHINAFLAVDMKQWRIDTFGELESDLLVRFEFACHFDVTDASSDQFVSSGKDRKGTNKPAIPDSALAHIVRRGSICDEVVII
jgi:hypothetical protein